MDEMIEISKEEYESLLEQVAWLEALLEAGVEDMDGIIDLAHEIYERDN